MKKYIWKNGILLTILTLIHTAYLWADEPLLIVTYPWPPYAIEAQGKLIGADVEITRAVFKNMGIDVAIKAFPWQRCLMMVKHQNADAILDVSLTSERKQFLYFPEEPLSEGVTVVFHKADRTLPYTDIEDLASLRFGTVIGYRYCDVIDNAPFIKNAERVPSLEQNFKKLMANRIDAVIEVDAVGYYTAKQMGISDQITIIPKALFCKDGNFLAFAKKPGYQKLSIRFSDTLKAFKKTRAHQRILNAYGNHLQTPLSDSP